VKPWYDFRGQERQKASFDNKQPNLNIQFFPSVSRRYEFPQLITCLDFWNVFYVLITL